jgi:rhodanese-related sulfurtransferase
MLELTSPVTAPPVADPADAHAHFALRLSLETDVADVADALAAGRRDFVLLDARSPEAYAAGHLPEALSVPHATITADVLDALPDGLIVAYCWGTHCNGAARAAARIGALGRPVKEMLGGYEHWVRGGHPVEA